MEIESWDLGVFWCPGNSDITSFLEFFFVLVNLGCFLQLSKFLLLCTVFQSNLLSLRQALPFLL